MWGVDNQGFSPPSYEDNPPVIKAYNKVMVSEKQLANLKPFTGADDNRRQQGRKKGQINRKTAIRRLLEQEIDPKLLLGSENGEFLAGLKDKTYLEAIIFTLINQAINKDTRASDLLLRELRYVDDKNPPDSPFNRDIVITVVNSSEEPDDSKCTGEPQGAELDEKDNL